MVCIQKYAEIPTSCPSVQPHHTHNVDITSCNPRPASASISAALASNLATATLGFEPSVGSPWHSDRSKSNIAPSQESSDGSGVNEKYQVHLIPIKGLHSCVFTIISSTMHSTWPPLSWLWSCPNLSNERKPFSVNCLQFASRIVEVLP